MFCVFQQMGRRKRRTSGIAKIKKYFLVPFFFARVSRVCDRVVPTKYSTQRGGGEFSLR